MKHIIIALLLATIKAQDTEDEIDCEDIADDDPCFTESGRCEGEGTGYWSGATDDCPGTCDCTDGVSTPTEDESTASESCEESYSNCFTESGRCSGTGTGYWSGNTDSCPGTCECEVESCEEDYSECFTASGKCSGTGTGYWSGNTDSCPGTCQCEDESGETGSGYSIGADDIQAFKDSSTSLIGTPCTADGPECPTEGDVCYGATITATDTTHPQYIQEYDAVIKEIANQRYCMNE